MHIPWESFVARYGPLARNVATGAGGRRRDVDDIVQEALIALVRAAERDPAAFESLEHARNYFLRSVRNLAAKSRERDLPMQPLSIEPTDDVADPALVEELRSRRERLASAIARLSEPERALLAARFFEHDTLAELAARLGVAISTLHAREQSLLDRLRKEIDGREERA